MGHQHSFKDGASATIAGCGCVLLANKDGTVIGAAEQCVSHGGDRKPGDCRVCETGPSFKKEQQGATMRDDVS